MKKVILLVALLTIFSIAAAEHSFGLKTGLNLASYRKTGPGAKFKLGAIWGIFYNIPLNQQYSIQPELLFTMKGQKYEIMMNDTDEYGSSHGTHKFKTSSSFSYLEVPILGKMEINRSEKLIVNIYMGPFFGFNLDNSYKVEFNNNENEGSEEVNFIEMGFTTGIMLAFTNNITFDARYTYGLTDVYKNGINHTVLSFMLGYKLK